MLLCLASESSTTLVSISKCFSLTVWQLSIQAGFNHLFKKIAFCADVIEQAKVGLCYLFVGICFKSGWYFLFSKQLLPPALTVS